MSATGGYVRSVACCSCILDFVGVATCSGEHLACGSAAGEATCAVQGSRSVTSFGSFRSSCHLGLSFLSLSLLSSSFGLLSVCLRLGISSLFISLCFFSVCRRLGISSLFISLCFL